jgi:hypothetical protein
MAYDAARAVVVLFGGTDGYTNYADTWTWNGTDWTEQHPVTSPPAACCPGLSFDAATQRIVLLESYSMETWTWDGVNWTKENPPKSPPERDGGMGFARSGKHVVLFGGDTCPTDICWDWGDTWIWHWGTWTKQHPLHSPGGRCCGEMAYDVARGRTVLFGGDSPTVLLDDTWTWDGHDWTQMTPITIPPARDEEGIAYDNTRHLIVMFGGRQGSLFLGDTWTWNGIDWTQR